MKNLEKLSINKLTEEDLIKVTGGKLPPAGSNPNPYSTSVPTQLLGNTTSNGTTTIDNSEDSGSQNDYETDLA